MYQICMGKYKLQKYSRKRLGTSLTQIDTDLQIQLKTPLDLIKEVEGI